MSGVFVRGLWGESPEDSEWPTAGHDSALVEAKRALTADFQPSPVLVYAWGQRNFDCLRSFGYDPILVSADAIVNYSTDGQERNSRSRFQVNWGVSHWRQKLQCIRMALESHDVGRAAIWMDWDVWQVAKLPADFWGRLEKGQDFQASLRIYVRKQCGWRRGDWAGMRRVPHGAWTYCRSLETVNRAIEVHAEHVPTFTDEVAWAKLLDIRHDRWIGDDKYKSMGYEPYCYNQGMGRRAIGRTVHPCDPSTKLFQNMGRY